MHGSARCLPVLAAVALVALVTTPGCSRHHFRQRADKDVEGIITQKNIFPQWPVTNWHVYPDPRARFADRFNPDRPPYPPDDPAARLVSPNPQRPTKKSGVGRVEGTGYIDLLQHWDAENRGAEGLPFAPVPPPGAPIPPPPAMGKSGATAPDNTIVRRDVSPGAPSLRQDGKWVGPPTIPAPTLLVGDRPAVRHALPTDTPSALIPASGTQPAPAAQAPPPPPTNATEFSPWVGTRPRFPSFDGPPRPVGPTVTPLRPPMVMIAVGEVEENGKPVPAVAVVPIEAGMQPSVPQPQPQPIPPPQPLPGQPALPVVPATGDPAADYLRALETGQVGYRITLEQAVELGLINAREFQDRREDLYLAALQVSLFRFNFAAQAFFIEQVVRQSTGRELANGGERWTLNTTTGVTKVFPTGAQLLVRLANQVIIDLSGNNPTTTFSNLTLSLSQPFLRGGGKAVVLEGLTLSERNLLYAIRSYARFRKLFFVAISAGGGYTNNPYGLQGLSPNLGRGIGGNLTSPSVGYLQLLLQQAFIKNKRQNVASLERLLRLYQAFREGGQQSPLQVGQVEVNLLNSRGNLLDGTGNNPGIRQYLDSLDNFKLQLGLPVTVPLELVDRPLQPIREQLARFDELFEQARDLGVEAARFDRAEAPAALRKRWLMLLTTSPLVRGTTFAKTIEERWKSWWPDKLTMPQLRARREELRAERRKLLTERVDREVRNRTAAKPEPEPPGESAKLLQLTADIELAEFEEKMREYEAQPWLKKEGRERLSLQDSFFNAAYNAFYLVALSAQNERLLRLYESWPELAPLPLEGGVDALQASLDDAYTAGIQAALTNRLDLMNARAQVVDAWRQIAVTANSLQGVFDVRYDLNSSTPSGGTNPFAFSGDRSSHQLTFRAELPLVRRAERNNYRAALVAYQRQRRTLMAFEDNIANDVRNDIRQLRTLAELYRIQKRAVELGYAQVDNAQAILFAPPVPGAGSDAGSAAALTQQVLQAQSSLLSAQNSLYTIWVQYLTARMNLYLDLELMPLDERGVWCDELFNRTDRQDQPGFRQPNERLHPPRPVGEGNGQGERP